tara:strand:- start:120 stop:401 length:282 start_codon:yes stop_codon:yes gene_type:complete
MTTPVQNFDLFDIEANDDLSQCVDVPGGVANPPPSSEQLTTIINQILDDNSEPIQAMDFAYAPHREYLAGAIAYAMLDCTDIHITTANTSEDK